jgi:hypothetical protein
MGDKKKKAVMHVFVIIVYTILTIIFTYPLIRHINTHILGDGYDANQFPIGFWWIYKAIVDLKTNPLFTDYIFYPFGTSLVFHTMTFLNGLLSIPLQPLLGITTTVNVFNLFTFVASAYGTFLLIDHIMNHKVAAFMGGFIFGFCPFRLMSAMGHYHSLNTQWIPFYVLFLLKLSKERSLRNSICCGLFLLLTALNSYNYLLFLCIFTVLFLSYLGITKRQSINRHLIFRVGLLICVFLLGFLPILYQIFQELQLYGDFVTSEVVGVDLLLFGIPSVFHPILGKISWKISPQLTPYLTYSTAYVGYSILLFSLYTSIRLRTHYSFSINFWILSGLCFFLLSLGPFLQINGQQVFHLGSWSFSVPLPYLLLLKLPVIAGARISGRFSVFLMLSLAVLAAYTIKSLFQKMVQIRRWLSLVGIIIVGGIVMLEYLMFPFPVLCDQSVSKIYFDIQKDLDDVSILELPLQLKSGGKTIAVGSSEIDLAQTIHQKRVIGGYVARVPVPVMRYFSQLPILKSLLAIQNGTILSEKTILQDKRYVDYFIRFLQLKYVILHERDRFGMGFFRREDRNKVLQNMQNYIETVFPIEELRTENYVTAYTLKLSQEVNNIDRQINCGTHAAHFHLAHNWSWDEVWNRKFSYNWATSRSSSMLIRFDDKSERACTFRVAPFVYPNAPQQIINVFVNKHFVGDIPLTNSWNTYTIPIPSKYINAGMNKLDFKYTYATSPSRTIGTKDGRRLSVAFDYIDCGTSTTKLAGDN